MVRRDPHDPTTGAPTLSTQPARWISPEQYLEAERRAETKSEYFDGQVFAMSGASLAHNRIVANLLVAIGQQLKRGPCLVLPSDMRLRVPATGLYTYPDVTVVCGTPQLEDEHRDILLNPTLLAEVLSDSTEPYDRGRKAEHYRRIPSLREYLLLRQDAPHVERYRRGEADWTLTVATSPDDVLALASIPCTLALREIYDGVL